MKKFKEPEEIEVNMFDYKKAKAPDELYSGGVGPCISIGAIYQKKGYMIHEVSTYRGFLKNINKLFNDLKKDVKDKSKLQIYVIGGEIGDDLEYGQDIEFGRKTVLEKIAENGFNNCVREVRWCDNNHCQTLRLMLSEGKAEIEDEEVGW
jgi:hypothetical protein